MLNDGVGLPVFAYLLSVVHAVTPCSAWTAWLVEGRSVRVLAVAGVRHVAG
jgi:hypothetical protein